jgi:hypothetical protein
MSNVDRTPAETDVRAESDDRTAARRAFLKKAVTTSATVPAVTLLMSAGVKARVVVVGC